MVLRETTVERVNYANSALNEKESRMYKRCDGKTISLLRLVGLEVAHFKQKPSVYKQIVGIFRTKVTNDALRNISSTISPNDVDMRICRYYSVQFP